MSGLADEIEQHLAGFRTAEIIREGFNVVIVGPPNAGKSSLLNAIAGREAAIVTDIPGTTRDIVRIEIDLRGQRVVFSDTAGLRESADEVEKIGIERAVDAARELQVLTQDRKLCSRVGFDVGIDGVLHGCLEDFDVVVVHIDHRSHVRAVEIGAGQSLESFEQRGLLVVRLRGEFDGLRGGKLAQARLRRRVLVDHALAEDAVDTDDHFVPRLEDVDECCLHPGAARPRHGERQTVLRAEDPAQPIRGGRGRIHVDDDADPALSNTRLFSQVEQKGCRCRVSAAGGKPDAGIRGRLKEVGRVVPRRASNRPIEVGNILQVGGGIVVVRRAGGRFRLDHPSLEARGEWSWDDNPFFGTRPFNGLLVILILFNSWDLKDSNNSLYALHRDGMAEPRYVVRDLGGSLGGTGIFRVKRNDVEQFERSLRRFGFER